MQTCQFKKSVAIVIPNWNGQHLISDCLQNLIKEIVSYTGKYEIIVVDDDSTDNSVNIIKTDFPSVKLLVNSKNEGVGKTVNFGVHNTSADIVYLLNTDVLVGKNFLIPLVKHFDYEDVFAVSSESYHEDRKTFREGRKTVLFRNIWFYNKRKQDKQFHNSPSNGPAFSVMATGGHSAFDRKKFLKLGGFDSLYHPFYWEDSDLCYRAWMRGWKVIHEPTSRVCHKSGVIKDIAAQQVINSIAHRNRMIFIWKNIRAGNILIPHFLGLMWRIVFSVFIMDRYFWQSFLYATSCLPEILKKRKVLQRSRSLKDMQILNMVILSCNFNG